MMHLSLVCDSQLFSSSVNVYFTPGHPRLYLQEKNRVVLFVESRYHNACLVVQLALFNNPVVIRDNE